MPKPVVGSGVMATVQELIESLVVNFPEDAEELRSALEVLQKHRISSCERLGKLSDVQWQRLDLPIGIEALLRDEALVSLGGQSGLKLQLPERRAQELEPQAKSSVRLPGPQAVAGSEVTWQQPLRVARAPALDDGELPLEPYELPEEGIHRRRGGGSGWSAATQRPEHSSRSSSGWSPAMQSPQLEEELTPPADLDEIWQQLLEDTLPPDKRKVLQDAWFATRRGYDRYMMYLEYASYLRKQEVTEEEREERRKQLEPLLREFGVNGDEGSSCPAGLMWSVLIGLLVFVAGIVYYAYTRQEPLHDLQAL